MQSPFSQHNATRRPTTVRRVRPEPRPAWLAVTHRDSFLRPPGELERAPSLDYAAKGRALELSPAQEPPRIHPISEPIHVLGGRGSEAEAKTPPEWCLAGSAGVQGTLGQRHLFGTERKGSNARRVERICNIAQQSKIPFEPETA